MSEETKETELKPKMKLFADFYLGEALFNGTKAARLAQYKGDDKTLAVVASKLLRIAKVSAYIEKKLETYGMGSNEVIARLAEIARGKVDDVLDDKGFFNLQEARERNKTNLLKKIKQKRTIRQSKTEIRDDMRGFLAEDEIEDIQSETEIIYEEVEFEMYSAHEALRDLGKVHKLFTDRTEFGGEVNLNHTGEVAFREAAEKVYGDKSENNQS